jgi:hypothetical protein
MTDPRETLLTAAHHAPGDEFVRELLLACAGAKPAVQAMFEGRPDINDPLRLLNGSFHGRLLRDLRRDGWTVIPVAGDTHPIRRGKRCYHLAISPSAPRAIRLAATIEGLERAAEQTLDYHKLEFAAGRLMGYPRSGTEAFLDLRPAARPGDLVGLVPERLLRWAGCVYAADAAGLRAARRHLAKLDRTFRTAYPELVDLSSIAN